MLFDGCCLVSGVPRGTLIRRYFNNINALGDVEDLQISVPLKNNKKKVSARTALPSRSHMCLYSRTALSNCLSMTLTERSNMIVLSVRLWDAFEYRRIRRTQPVKPIHQLVERRHHVGQHTSEDQPSKLYSPWHALDTTASRGLVSNPYSAFRASKTASCWARVVPGAAVAACTNLPTASCCVSISSTVVRASNGANFLLIATTVHPTTHRL